jgi:polyhydroxybutyrate depolymerase
MQLVAAVILAACASESPPADEDDGKPAATAASGATGSAGGATGPGGAGGAGGSGGAPFACAPGSKTGPAEGAVGEKTAGGVDFNVRAPAGYDASAGHPLLVVFSPAGVQNPVQTEQFTGLTAPATARGYVVAYVNHRSPQSAAVIQDLASATGLVAARWCIDETRIYFTGHSDGGSVASIAPLVGTMPRPAAIAPSAAGVNKGYLAQATCPGALPAMLIHSQNDSLFPPPDFGPAAADFWAGCSGCEASSTPLQDGCLRRDGCDGRSEVLYCQTIGAHGQWYGLNASMLDFFDRHASAP